MKLSLENHINNELNDLHALIGRPVRFAIIRSRVVQKELVGVFLSFAEFA
jgi:hypothetical protein